MITQNLEDIQNCPDSFILTLQRLEFFDDTTIGRLYFGNSVEPFCWVLEDKEREVKIDRITAIARGVYKIAITHSNRFDREMPLIYNMDDYSINLNGLSFKGVRFHGGNTHEDTEGCPLVAYNRISDKVIQGTAEKELTKAIKRHLDNYKHLYLHIY